MFLPAVTILIQLGNNKMGYCKIRNPNIEIPACGRQAKQILNSNFKILNFLFAIFVF